MDDVERMQQEIDLLKEMVKELVAEHNEMTNWLAWFRRSFARYMTYAWYRFFMWLIPVGLPAYERRIIVDRIAMRDRRPVTRSGDFRTGTPRTRDRKPKVRTDV